MFANGTPTSTGVVVFGGLANNGSAAPHHITMRNITVAAPRSGGSVPQDHAIYVFDLSRPGGPHDLLFEDITGDGPGHHLASAFHFDHSTRVTQRLERDRPAPDSRHRHPAGDHRVGRARCTTLLFEDITITNSTRFAVRYENGSDYRVVFQERRVSSGSGSQGFYSSLGTPAARRHPLGLHLPLTVRTASVPRHDRAPAQAGARSP